MNFAEFQIWREQNLIGAVLDCAETNLYRALAPLQSKQVNPSSQHQVYRCDLARTWLKRYGFDESLSRRALVCRGVRHALSLIFAELARTNSRLLLPGDVYPVYLELARAAGIEPKTYATLPQPTFPQVQADDYPEYLLLANPLKPLGRFLQADELAKIDKWLNGAARRHLIVDCVYDLGIPFHFTTQSILQTGRAILLHSVTKAWLSPKTFGVALLPNANPELETIFRNESPSPDQLRLAEQFLSRDALLPAKVVEALADRKQKLLARLPGAVLDSFVLDPASAVPGCYLFPVGVSAEQMLQQHNVLGIPASAFGADWDGCILSSLCGNCRETAGGAK